MQPRCAAAKRFFASNLSPASRPAFVDFTSLTTDAALLSLQEPAPRALDAHGDDGSLTLNMLEDAFGQSFSVFDVESGELNHVARGWLHVDLAARLPLLEEIALRGQVEFVEDCAPLVVLAAPLPTGEEGIVRQIAISTFVTQFPSGADDVAAAAQALGVEKESCYRWCRQQQVWPTRGIEQLSRLIVGQAGCELQNVQLKRQLTNVSQHLLQTFEELNLLHRINENLSLSSSEQHLLELAVDWLSDVVPAECLLACFEPETRLVRGSESGGDERQWVLAGKCPFPREEYDQFFERLGPDAHENNLLLDGEVTRASNWFYPAVREVISVPIRTGDTVLGWLIAVNRQATHRRGGATFGTLETSLLSSVASILGMHTGNVRMFRGQAEFFEGTVRALSSSIDAKDPSTRGHSDRVARIAVCLADHLGCSREELNTIFLGGLLHDIGKIGINDEVLRKPGKLTDAEYEHIKLHPELGYRILKRVRQLEHVLPVVLHHHEAWDGSGYPGNLVGEETPWLARIAAVADAFDAMTSDRPYRPGMPAEKLDEIFRAGAGRQWDARVIDAFFAVRDQIEAVVQEDREELALDVNQWHTRGALT